MYRWKSWGMWLFAVVLLVPEAARAQRTGCPIERKTLVRSNNNSLLLPGAQECIPVYGQHQERLHVVTNATHGDYELRVTHSLAVIAVVDPWTDGNAKRVRNQILPWYGTYSVCVRNNSWYTALGVRMTADVVDHTCDVAPSLCYGSRGPDCDNATPAGTGCSAPDPSNQMLRRCAVSVGAARHDSCCTRYPGGIMCGGVGWDGSPAEEPLAWDRPAGFAWPYDYPNRGTYVMCQKEWDMAIFDSTGAWAVWQDWFDGTQPTYRNKLAAIELTPPRISSMGSAYYDEGGPTASARRAPPGTELYLSDASRGWCGTGTYAVLEGGKARCYVQTCSDRVRNQNESDVDCGGVCGSCGNGLRCNSGADCASGLCSGGVCQAGATSTNTCGNGQWDRGEADVDCGGACATRCASGQSCTRNGDCQSNSCYVAEYMCR